MVGKASLLLVMGFSLIFLVFGHRFNTMSNGAVDNFTNYYTDDIAHNLASSGANLAANAVFLNNNWVSGYSNLHMNGGIINVSVQIIDATLNIRKIVSTGTYNGADRTVEVLLSPTKFSKFAYYSENEGNNIRWTNRDTVFGPFHTQDNLLTDNHPVFGVTGYRTTIKGKVVYADYYDVYGLADPKTTAQKNLYNQSKANDKPEFHGSFQDGVDEPLPNDGLDPLRNAAAAGGLVINKTSSYDTAYITFKVDSVKIKLGYKKPTVTYLTSTAAPNGVIYANGMDIRLKGTVQGQYSVVGDKNIYLDDDILYKTNPKLNPNSTDILGILAQSNILIKDDKHGNVNTKNIIIDAAMYCQDGGFGAQNYDTRSIDGNINLLGGITQNIRQAVGTYSGNTIKSGFNKLYRYDERLMKMYPPYFPSCGGFQIISWKE